MGACKGVARQLSDCEMISVLLSIRVAQLDDHTLNVVHNSYGICVEKGASTLENSEHRSSYVDSMLANLDAYFVLLEQTARLNLDAVAESVFELRCVADRSNLSIRAIDNANNARKTTREGSLKAVGL